MAPRPRVTRFSTVGFRHATSSCSRCQPRPSPPSYTPMRGSLCSRRTLKSPVRTQGVRWMSAYVASNDRGSLCLLSQSSSSRTPVGCVRALGTRLTPTLAPRLPADWFSRDHRFHRRRFSPLPTRRPPWLPLFIRHHDSTRSDRPIARRIAAPWPTRDGKSPRAVDQPPPRNERHRPSPYVVWSIGLWLWR